MEKNEIVAIMVSLHEWRMESGGRAIFYEHTEDKEDGSYLTISADISTDDDTIKSTVSIWYEKDTFADARGKIEDWQNKLEKFERVSRGSM